MFFISSIIIVLVVIVVLVEDNKKSIVGLTFYFFVLYRDFKATTAFDKTRGFLAPHIKGGFSYWKMEE
ncbi:MAG: hypothetical protein ABR887_04255 [Methanoregulaceae archaeon]